MYITDLNGCEIEITDLKEAVKIAKRNTGYSHEDKSFSEFDKRQKVELQLKIGDFFYAANLSFSNNISSICLGVLYPSTECVLLVL